MILVLAILAAFLFLPSPWGVAVVVAAACFEVLEISIWRRTLHWRTKTGAEGLVGMRAQVVEACRPNGQVRVRGELWKAHSAEPLAVGQEALVASVHGLVLDVESAPAAGGASAPG